MKCPFCGSLDTQVIETRLAEDGLSIRRRRRCQSCDKRFTTYETADVRLPQVVKSNGTREEFSENKLREGFKRALHKRPVSAPLVDEALSGILQRLLTLGEREIPARDLGEMVMLALKKLDKVAYIRFASVYRSFQDIDDFRDALREVDK
jgi:transcriptional repressor NrdR